MTNLASSQKCDFSGVGDIGAPQLSWVGRSSAHEGTVAKEVVEFCFLTVVTIPFKGENLNSKSSTNSTIGTQVPSCWCQISFGDKILFPVNNIEYIRFV